MYDNISEYYFYRYAVEQLFDCIKKAVRIIRFDSTESLRRYIERFGAFAPAALTMIQADQVVMPVLPGFFGCAVIFGSI